MLRLRNLIVFLMLLLAVPSMAQQLGEGRGEPTPLEIWAQKRAAARRALDRARFVAEAQHQAGDKTAAARLAKLNQIALKTDFQDDPEVKRLQAEEKAAPRVSPEALDTIWKDVPADELDSTARKLVEDAIDEVIIDLAGTTGPERARLKKRLAELLELYKKKGSLAGENEAQALRLLELERKNPGRVGPDVRKLDPAKKLDHYRKAAKRLSTPAPTDEFDYDSSYEPRGLVRGSYITSADGRDDGPTGVSRGDTRGVRLEVGGFEAGWH